MTDEQRATIYGQAMLELKECKADIAALEAYFSAYAERLQDAGGSIRRFLSDPCANKLVDLGEYVKQNNLRLTRADFEEKVDELIKLSRRARELEQQVSKF